MALKEIFDLLTGHAVHMRRMANILECAICMEPIRIAMMSSCCSTNYCSACIRQFLTVKSECPHCRKCLTTVELKNNRALEGASDAFQQLSKSWDGLCLKLKSSGKALVSIDLEELKVDGQIKQKEEDEQTALLKRQLIEKALSSVVGSVPEQSENHLEKAERMGKCRLPSPQSPAESSIEVLHSFSGINKPEEQNSEKQANSIFPWAKRFDSEHEGTTLNPSSGPSSSSEPSRSSSSVSAHKGSPVKNKKGIMRFFNRTSPTPSAVSKHCAPWHQRDAGTSSRSASTIIHDQSDEDKNGHAQTASTSSSQASFSHLSAGTSVIKWVSCPVCDAHVEISKINLHLDRCLSQKAGEDQADGASASSGIPSSVGAGSNRREPIGKTVYSLLKDSQIKQLLREANLTDAGDRRACIQRHQRYVVLYNAECDALNPKPVSEIRRKLEEEEAAKNTEARHKRTVAALNNSSGSVHSEDRFSKLLSDLRGRGYHPKKLRSLMEEDQGDSQESDESGSMVPQYGSSASAGPSTDTSSRTFTSGRDVESNDATDDFVYDSDDSLLLTSNSLNTSRVTNDFLSSSWLSTNPSDSSINVTEEDPTIPSGDDDSDDSFVTRNSLNTSITNQHFSSSLSTNPSDLPVTEEDSTIPSGEVDTEEFRGTTDDDGSFMEDSGDLVMEQEGIVNGSSVVEEANELPVDEDEDEDDFVDEENRNNDSGSNFSEDEAAVRSLSRTGGIKRPRSRSEGQEAKRFRGLSGGEDASPVPLRRSSRARKVRLLLD